MECKNCGADMRIVGARKSERDGGVYRVLVHRCMNPRCTNNATAETVHRIGDVVRVDDSTESSKS